MELSVRNTLRPILRRYLVKNKMNYKKKEEKVVEYIKKEYRAEAIIFVGSRAVGDFKPNSDWDIWIITDNKNMKDERDTKGKYGLQGEDFDLYTCSTKQKFDWNLFWLRLRFHKIMYDPKGFGARLVKQAMKEYDKGPKVTREWVLGRRDKATRYMNKFEDNLEDKNYAELFNGICWHFVENIIDWWFMFRKEWPLRRQNKFDYIKKKDPKFYFQLQKVFSDKTSFKQKVDAFRKIHDIFFNSKEYLILVR